MTIVRYHPLLVALHWLLSVAILGMLAVGMIGFDLFKDDDPAKLKLVAMHMAGGISILVLMVLRFGVRWATDLPPPASTGRPKPDKVAGAVHVALYVLVVATALAGLISSLQAGVNKAVFGSGADPLPTMETLDKLPVFSAHGLFAWLLLLLVVLHAVAAIYHQHVLKDGLISRMTFGPRRAER